MLDGHGNLVAYLWMYRAGEPGVGVAVLGHADHENDEIMYLLFRERCGRRRSRPGGWCLQPARLRHRRPRVPQGQAGFEPERGGVAPVVLTAGSASSSREARVYPAYLFEKAATGCACSPRGSGE